MEPACLCEKLKNLLLCLTSACLSKDLDRKRMDQQVEKEASLKKTLENGCGFNEKWAWHKNFAHVIKTEPPFKKSCIRHCREERLVGRLHELQSKLKISEKSHVPGTSTGATSLPGVTFGHVSQVNEPSSGLTSQLVQCSNEVQCDHTREVNRAPADLSTALLSQQVPPSL